MTLADLDRLIIQGLDGNPTAVGKHIDPHTAMQVSAFFNGVQIYADTIGSLPLHLYERLQPRGRRRATERQLYHVLHTEPNPYMSAKSFRSALEGHIPGWGNAYAEIVWDDAGEVRELWPLRPDRTEPVWHGGQLWYQTRIETQGYLLPAFRVLHVPGFGFDGVRGYSVVKLARESLGLSLATEEHGARLFGNGAVPKTVLEYPGKLSDKAEENLKTSFEQRHMGLDKSHRLAILQEGMKLQQIGLDNEDSQFLQTRQFEISEIARWLNLPPHMLKDLTRSSNNNIEHQGLEFVQYSLTPHLVAWEQAIALRCMTREERRRYYAEHAVEGLLRGDSAARSQWYREMAGIGVYSINDIRERENENPVEGGDERFVPLNMGLLRNAGEGKERDRGHMTVNEKRIEDGLLPIPGGDAIFLPSSTIPALEFPEEEAEGAM